MIKACSRTWFYGRDVTWGPGTGFGKTLRVLEGWVLNQAVGEAPEWAGLGLGPESMGGVLLGTFRRLSLTLKQTGRKGDSVMGCCWRVWSGF